MQAANNGKNANVGGGMSKPILGVVFLILILVGLYYVYQYLYGSSPAQAEVKILEGTKAATATSSDSGSGLDAVGVTDISGIVDGGEYTTSFWVYVADTKDMAKETRLVNLMEIGQSTWTVTGATKTRPGKTFLYVGLDPRTGTLIVRQNTGDDSYNIDNDLTDAVSVSATSYKLSGLISSYNGPATTYKDDDRCDILNGVEYQRWVLVSVVGNGRTLDVYVDGKLARSCVYKSFNSSGSTSGTGRVFFGLGNEKKFKGYFSAGTYANYAYTPDKIWALYQAGPGGSSSIGDFFKNLFNINVTFSSTGGLQPSA